MSGLQQLIRDRLAELEAQGVSERQAAERAGISNTTLNNWKHGRLPKRWSDARLLQLSKALDVPAQRLAEMAGRRRYEPPAEFVLPEKYRGLRGEYQTIILGALEAAWRAQQHADEADDMDED